MAPKKIKIDESKNLSSSSSSSLSSINTVCHIDRVDNYILFDILKRLPIRDIIRTGNVCTRWRSMRSELGARQRRIMLFDNAMQSRLNYFTSRFNQPVHLDLWRVAIRIPPLKSANKFYDFINFIMQTFPAISIFDFVCQIDRDMFRYMIENVLRRYAAQLTHLRLIFAIRTQNSPFSGEKSIQSYSSYTFPALRHFTIYCDDDIVWNLVWKDYGDYEDYEDYEDFLEKLLLKNMPILEELFYGLRSSWQEPLNRNSRFWKLHNFPHLTRFGVLREHIDYPTPPILIDWLQSVDDLAARRLIDFRFHYTHHYADISHYPSLIADKFPNLRDLQLSLQNNRIPIDDLLQSIAKLDALAYLRIVDTPNDYFTEKIEQYYQDNGPPIAPSYSLRNLHFSFVNWDRKCNSFRNVIPFSSLSSTLSSIFPALEQIRQSDIRVTLHESILPEMCDMLPPKRIRKSGYFCVNRSVISQTNDDKVSSSTRRIKIETINDWHTIDQFEIEEDDGDSNTVDQSIKLWLRQQINKVVRELRYLDISCIAFSADELLDLLPRLPQLINLRISASRHYFCDLDAAMQRIITDPNKSNKFGSNDQLQTLHIDRIWSASDDDPYRISLNDHFCRIASKLWPNIRTLKFDGLISNVNCFELTAHDELWLSHLPRWFNSLQKIFLLKQRLPLYCVTPERSVERSFRLEPTQFEIDNSNYDIRYLSTPLSDKEEEKLLHLRLTIVQRVLNITETSSK